MTGPTSSPAGSGAISGATARSALRAARVERGWSQAEAARALRELAGRRAGPEASAASLKTQLSRWENGHSRPEPEYRTLLSELYGRPPDRLGLQPADPAAGSTGAERLRAELAAAAAVDDAVLALWTVQLDAGRRIDDELGAAGAAGVVLALVEQLARTVHHTPRPDRRAAVAGILTGAAVLAASQSLDVGDPDGAWKHLDTAAVAARDASSSAALLVAQLGRAEVLREIGQARSAVELLDRLRPEPESPGTQVRLAAARGMAYAAAGDAPAAHRALDDAARWSAESPGLPEVDVLHPVGIEVEVEPAEVHGWHGRALLDLGEQGAAARLESALASGPRAVRHRAGLHADLALAMARSDGEAAAEHAHRARALAERIGSRQVTARLAGVAR
jgi:transcriptional regulator with XRE-family HTH domain